MSPDRATCEQVAMLRAYGAERDETLARIVRALEADPRVIAAWLAGSFGRGDADAWSDLDLHVAVVDDAFSPFWNDRHRFYECIGSPILIQPEMPANAGFPGWTFQLVYVATPTGPVEIDLSAGPASVASRPPATRLLLDRVGIPIDSPPSLSAEERQGQADWWLTFFWAMAPIAVKYAGRGQSRQAASQIDLLAQAAIALWRLVTVPDGPLPWAPVSNCPIEPELDAQLPRLGWTITPPAALGVVVDLCAFVERLHPALAAQGITIPSHMPEAVATLGRLAEAAIHGVDQGTPRPYR